MGPISSTRRWGKTSWFHSIMSIRLYVKHSASSEKEINKAAPLERRLKGGFTLNDFCFRFCRIVLWVKCGFIKTSHACVCVNMIDSLMGHSLALQGLLFLHIEIGRGTGSQLYGKKKTRPAAAKGPRTSEVLRMQLEWGLGRRKKTLNNFYFGYLDS